MKKVKPKTGKCVDCDEPILENSVRCRSCASKYRMSQVDVSGDKNPNWDGGKTVAYCVDCGKHISKYHKRCKSCARKNELHPNWQGGKSRPVCIDCGKRILQGNTRCRECWEKFNVGENNAAWKGGPKYCIDCGVKLGGTRPSSTRERCEKCYHAYAIKENHSMWNGGFPVCVDCGERVKKRGAIRCTECHKKYAFKENAPRWLGGIGKEPYPFEFDDKLKELIRERDNYTCQICGKKQEDHYRKLDIHHIDYDKDNLNPNNLVALCQSCHSSTNVNRKQWQDGFKFLQQMK